MSIRTCKYILLLIFLNSIANAYAMENDVVSVYATTCEEVKPNEAKSSVRVRATDKASFKAVENLAQMQEYRNQYPTHDFNVLVYKIVDNYLEDLTIRTTEQTDEQLCVEVTGYLQEKNIQAAINENMQKHEVMKEDYPQALEIENRQDALQPVVTDLPPKPEITIKKEIAAETALNEEAVSINGNVRVFIEPTTFFNNTSTDAFVPEIQQILQQEKNVTFINDKKSADYIIKSNVLRAKVDPINSKTNRLQMVIAVELLKTGNGKEFTDHQNRFILFESSEDEQIVANSLMKKLLRQAIKNIAPKIEASVSDNGAVITPPAKSAEI